MRGSTFSEHVSTYFNSVLETFTDYYPTSANSILPQISSAFAAQELQLSEKLNTIYACVALVLVVLYLFKQLLHLDQMGEAPLVHMKEGDDEVEVDTVEAGDDVDCDVRTATSRVLDIKRIMDKCSIFKSA